MGYTCLGQCVINQPNIAFCKFLLENGADPNLYNIFGTNAVMECAMSCSVECLKLLLNLVVIHN